MSCDVPDVQPIEGIACVRFVLLFSDPCSWAPGPGVPGYRGGLRPCCCFLVLVNMASPDMRRGPKVRFVFSFVSAKWASPQLTGPVQGCKTIFLTRPNLLTGSYLLKGSRSQKIRSN